MASVVRFHEVDGPDVLRIDAPTWLSEAAEQ
jgi:hypothetical protein